MTRDELIAIMVAEIFNHSEENFGHCEAIAASQLAALDKAGLAVVPVEPTKRMVDVGRIQFWVDPDDHGGDISEGTRQAWFAMVNTGRIDKEPEDD